MRHRPVLRGGNHDSPHEVDDNRGFAFLNMRYTHGERSLKFTAGWEPEIVRERVVAKGKWRYDGLSKYEHSATLIARKFNYTSADIDFLEENLDVVTLDYVDYSTNSEGEVFFWRFVGPMDPPEGRTHPSFTKAIEYFPSYGDVELEWSDPDAA